MRILVLTQVLPYPLDSGPKFKTYYVLKCLAARHEVTLASFARPDDDPCALDHLKTVVHAVHTAPMTRSPIQDGRFMLQSLATNRPFLMLRDERSAMRALLRQLTGNGAPGTQDGNHRFSGLGPPPFDGVYADQLNMAMYALNVPAARRVLDEHNVLWALCKRICATLPHGPRRWALEREWRLLREYEREMSRRFNAILTVSEADRTALAEVADGPARLEVMPIAIDPGGYVIPRQPTEPHILHLGTMFWPPNSDAVLWFAREIYPRIQARLPAVRFSIVGAHPPPEVCALAAGDASITVTGYVPDTEPILRRSSLLVVPLRAGGGMRVKILNALAQGLPIVTTTIGYEGIAAVPGRDLLVADTPEAFAAACLRVLTDEALAQTLAANGRGLVEQVYDYRVVCKTLDEIFE
jgi:glycosyltransferase involved in cell wall biosynthesis